MSSPVSTKSPGFARVEKTTAIACCAPLVTSTRSADASTPTRSTRRAPGFALPARTIMWLVVEHRPRIAIRENVCHAIGKLAAHGIGQQTVRGQIDRGGLELRSAQMETLLASHERALVRPRADETSPLGFRVAAGHRRQRHLELVREVFVAAEAVPPSASRPLTMSSAMAFAMAW